MMTPAAKKGRDIVIRIAKAQDQALRLCLRLAATDGQRTLSELAGQESMPEPTAAKLLGLLRRGGVVEALRGRKGGYLLAAPAREISVAAVLRSVGDPTSLYSCHDGSSAKEPCPRNDDCSLRSVWRHLKLQVTDLLEGTSLADLLQSELWVGASLARRWPVDPVTRDRDRPRLTVSGSIAKGEAKS
jgi:Rrf2 family protein